MFLRKLIIERIDATGAAHLCPIAHIDNFAMRNFTNDAVFDDTLPAADGQLEAGLRVSIDRLTIAGRLVPPQILPRPHGPSPHHRTIGRNSERPIVARTLGGRHSPVTRSGPLGLVTHLAFSIGRRWRKASIVSASDKNACTGPELPNPNSKEEYMTNLKRLLCLSAGFIFFGVSNHAIASPVGSVNISNCTPNGGLQFSATTFTWLPSAGSGLGCIAAGPSSSLVYSGRNVHQWHRDD